MTVDLRTELQARWQRARKALLAESIDALFLVPGTNFRYFTGLGINTRERLTALVLTPGAAVLVFPQFEEGRLARTEVYDLCDELVPWQENDDPYQLAADHLTEARQIAIDPLLPFWQYERLAGHCQASFQNAAAVVEPLRLRKSSWELNQIRKACAITADAVASQLGRFDELSKPFVAEDERDLLIKRFRQEGSEMGTALLQFDADSADPHAQSGGEISNPYVTLIDSGANVNGYWADLTRTRCHDFGRAPEFADIYRIVWEAQQAAISAVRPGATAESIDRAAREVIEAAGYGEYFIHRVGHGLGLDIHEPPYLVAGNQLVLQPGMVFTIEPGIYLPGKFGIRIEDNVVVTETGVEVLSPQTGKPEEELSNV